MDGYTDEISKPQLPYIIKRFVIPQNAKVNTLEVTPYTEIRLNGNFLVYPSQEQVMVDYQVADTAGFSYPDPEIYSSDQYYPANHCDKISEELYLGYKLVTLRLYPIRYKGSTKELCLNSLHIAIDYESDAFSEEIGSGMQSTRRAAEEHDFIASIVVNKEDLQSFYGTSLNRISRLSANPVPILGEDPEFLIPDYIIITADSLKPVFKKMIDWKRKKGYYALIKTVEEIARGFQGNDLPEKIRNYLKYAYGKWGSSLYVLLGGDTDIIPPRYCVSTKNTMCPADPYYANVQGSSDWNHNKNNKYGESSDRVPSHSQNINIGRAPVKNKGEVLQFIEKVISYEHADGVMSDPSYYRNRLLTAARLGVSDTCTMSGTYSVYESYLKNKARTRFLFDEWKVTGPTPAPDPLCALLTKDNFLSALKNGIDSLRHFHIIYHLDHSGPQAMGTSSKKRGESITNTDVDGLANGRFYQIVVSAGCDPASFQKDCIAEHFINNPNGGAVAFIGNTDSGFEYEYHQYEYFEKRLSESNGCSLSDAYRAASLYSSISKTWRLHLFGDPSMQIWTDTPKQFNINVSSQLDQYGAYNLVTVTPKQQLPQNTVLSFYKEDDIYYVDTLGNAEKTFSVVPCLAGTLHVTITAPNYKPYETSIEFPSTVFNSSLAVDTLIIKDGLSQESNGNGNGKIEAGETVAVDIILKNVGRLGLPDIHSEIEFNSDKVTLHTKTLVWNRISPGETSTATLVFSTANDMAESLLSDLKGLRFSFCHSEDVNGEPLYIKEIKFDLYQADLHVENRKIVYTGNGNLTIDPGELVKMDITLANYMQGGTTGISATLQGDHIATCSADYPDIEGHGRAVNTLPFTFRVASTYQVGSPLNATLRIQNRYGKVWEHSIDLAEVCNTVDPQYLRYTCERQMIQPYWQHDANQFIGYNIYRSLSDNAGNNLEQYVKLNDQPLRFTYYTDQDVVPLDRYYYKVTALSATGAESDLDASPVISASTSYQSIGLFPVPVTESENGRVDNSAFAVDIDNDGYMELFTGVRLSTEKSLLIAKNINGDDLFDIDHNVTTHSGFVEIPKEFSGNPAICSLTGDGEPLIFFANRFGSSLFCYSFKDDDHNGKPDMRWEKSFPGSSFMNSVIAEDLDGDGTKELILRSEGSLGKIYVYSVVNDNLHSFGIGNYYNDVAIADLDGDGQKEIIAGYRNGGVCIFRYDGTPFSVNPVFTRSGYAFHSTPVVCDLDNDGTKEILIVGRANSGNGTAVFAFKPDGTPVIGWDGTQTSGYSLDSDQRNLAPNLSVGDLNHDGNLEVVVFGQGDIKIWRNDGILLNQILVDGLFKQVSPILADVDEDDNIEILVPVEDRIYAFHLDGSAVKGFPVIIDDIHTRANPCVADIDNDGKNELVASGRRFMYVWKTPGDADKIEWGMDRHNIRNTGEYRCPPKIIRTNTIWNQSYNLCGDLVVNSGVLTINSACTLRLNGDARLVVKKGATLKLDGGSIENADVSVENGGLIQILNYGKITLCKNGFFNVQEGGLLDYDLGEILTNP